MSRSDQLETRVGIGPITNDQVYECRYRLSLLHSLLLIAEHWQQVPFPLYCIMMYSPGLPRARLCRLSLEPLALGKLWGCNARTSCHRPSKAYSRMCKPICRQAARRTVFVSSTLAFHHPCKLRLRDSAQRPRPEVVQPTRLTRSTRAPHTMWIMIDEPFAD